MTHKISEGNIYLLLIVVCCLLFIPGMMVDVMEVDAAQYASMSVEMLHTGNFLQVYEQGRDYLDKPPLLFWLSSLSYYFFGIHNWSYKLPSILFTLLAVYSVFRFSKLYYSETTALLASLLTVSAQAVMLMNNDIRTDNLLLGSVMLAVWQIGEIDRGSVKWKHAALAGVGIGLGMLAKGPLGLVMPVLCYGPVWLIQRNWKIIFKPIWLLTLLIIMIILLPMCIGLYLQFDAQPDKIIHGRTGVSGLYFFFWEQSFGRITGASEWKNTSGPFFFVHTFAWAFFPWIIYLVPSLVSVIRKRRIPEWFTFCGFLLTFLALSSSRFKLPHYIYVVIPFAAIITSHWIQQTSTRVYFKVTQWIPALLTLIFICFIQFFAFPVSVFWFVVFLIGPLLGMALPLLRITDTRTRSVALGVYAIFHLNLMFSIWFYPHLLQYQSSSVAMKWARHQKIPQDDIYHFKTHKSALHFYNKAVVPAFDPNNAIAADIIYVFTRDVHLEELETNFPKAEKIETFEDFPVTRMNLVFLNQKRRAERLDSTYLLKIFGKSK